ncbi:MAG: hypothetical protein AB8H79_05945 [Myxococcota bacterium]
MRVGFWMRAPVVIVVLSLACGGLPSRQDYGGELGPESRDTATLCLKDKALYAVFDECSPTCENYSSTCVGYDKEDRY